jgi:hypothetical protein
VVQGKITTFIATFLLKALVASLKYRVRVNIWCLMPHSTIIQLYRWRSVLLVEET